jgi:O-acetylhomoserine/O-acetylserine sulfhydrylase-like pyridoxal-dependent enzyme
LERLDGLEGLRTVGELWLNHNHVLTDVTAAHGIETVYGGVLIQSNPSLATADAQALADAIPNKGVVSIVDNAP